MTKERESMTNRILRSSRTLVAGIVSIAILGLASGIANAQSFFAGTAKTEITPLNNGFPTMWLAGYGSTLRQNPATGTAESLYVRALAIKDSLGTKVIVAADVLGFTPTLHNQISAIVQQRYGVPVENLMLNASHTHSGPVLTDNLFPELTYNLSPPNLQIVAKYTNWFRDAVVDTIGEAISNLLGPGSSVNLSYGVTAMTGAAFYRSTLNNGSESVLTDIPVLAVRSASASNNVVAIVFSYAVHPVKNSDLNYHSEYPGVAASALESAFPGSVALFLQGCAGDLDPLVSITQTGTVLAGQVSALVNTTGVTGPSPVTGPITTMYRRINLPLDVYQQGATMAEKDEETTVHTRLRASYKRIFDAISDPSSIYRKHAKRMMDAIDNYTLSDVEPLPVQVWQFGATTPVLLVALGGEAVSGYSIAIKNQSRAKTGNDSKRVWVTAYTNEVPGYVPSDEYLYVSSGGYEAGFASANMEGARVADGSQVYYEQPSRLKPAVRADGTVTLDGAEQILLKAVRSVVNAITAP